MKVSKKARETEVQMSRHTNSSSVSGYAVRPSPRPPRPAQHQLGVTPQSRPITWRALQSGPRWNASERLSWLVVNPRFCPWDESGASKLHNPRQGALGRGSWVVFSREPRHFRVVLLYFLLGLFCGGEWVRYSISINCVFVSGLVSGNEHVVYGGKGLESLHC